jgi:hypothetical protein
VTSIGNNAFYECSSLTSITIGSGVGYIEPIGNNAFANCTDLTDVYCYAENVPETNSDAFNGSYINYATLHVPEGSMDAYSASAPWSDFGTIKSLKAYTVSMADGTVDAGNWTIEPTEATDPGVAAGTEVKAYYGGTKKVKSVKAVKKASDNPFANITVDDLGKVIGADSKIYANADAATAAGTTAVAMICYVSDGHGLALAMADEDNMSWDDAISACSNKNTTTPVTGCTWKLATSKEWSNMINVAGYTVLRDGFSSVGGTNLLGSTKTAYYWSSSLDNIQGDPWFYDFNIGFWHADMKDLYSNNVRACLAF